MALETVKAKEGLVATKTIEAVKVTRSFNFLLRSQSLISLETFEAIKTLGGP